MTKTRIANKRYAKQGQRKSGSGGSWIVVLLGFIIILIGMGLVMRGGGCSDEADRHAAAKKVVEALERTNRADRALEVGNYGEARQLLKRVQSKLTEALGNMQQEVSFD